MKRELAPPSQLAMARAEAVRFSRRYGVWFVVLTTAGGYESRAHAPGEGAGQLVHTFINGKRQEEEWR